MIEVLQSICLQHPLDTFGSLPMLHSNLFRILDLTKECSEDFGLKRYSALADAEADERGAIMAVEGARIHTQVLRNWGYPQHMRKITRELFEPLEHECRSMIGIGPLAFLTLTDSLSRDCSGRAFQFMQRIGNAFREKNLRRMIKSFCSLVGTSDEETEKMHDLMKSRPGSLEEKRFFLDSYFHQFLPSLFSFTAEKCAATLTDGTSAAQIQPLLDNLSYRFGDLSNENPEHLLMQSKIRIRPIIAIDDGTYFVPIHGLFNSFFTEIVESWLRPHPYLKEKYHHRRATYLEKALTSLLIQNFPGCLVETGTTWEDSVNGKTYENDCLVVCGPLAIVFEAKSERVDDVAKRGGIRTLENHYETMVSEPAEQATRLARILEEGSRVSHFQTKGGRKFQLDLSAIRRAICVSVTLDWFPAATLSWKHLVESKLVSADSRPAINVSLADLLIVLEVLESPARRLHYFWRRTEWESTVQYLADEEDLLVYYLSEGLTIPRSEDGTAIESMSLYGNSDELHRYYMAEWADAENLPPRPRRILSDWWLSIVDRIESIDLPYRWDIACVLLDLNFERQLDFEKRFNEVVQTVRREGNECGKDGLLTFANHSESIGAVVGFAYRQLSRAERNERAAELANQARVSAGADRVVIIGRDVDLLSRPYDFVGFVDQWS